MVEASDDKDKGSSHLLPNEKFWASQYDFLVGKGYQLRPRYQPGFKPDSEESGLVFGPYYVLDAIQVEDGRKVCLKRMSADESLRAREVGLELGKQEGNHCVPILNFISIGREGDRIAVMPFLREFDSPAFTTIEEVLGAISQFLEGLEFLHKHNVAHRDACAGNMMMNASELIPGGWHMVRPWSEDGIKPISVVPRSSVKIPYYFIDFGLSVDFDPSNPTATGVVGQDKTVPEFKDPDATYDPCKLDIYQLGNAFKARLLDTYDGLDFLGPLVSSMTRQEPAERPTATEARQMLETARKDLDEKAAVSLKPGVEVLGDPRTKKDKHVAATEPKPKKESIPIKARVFALYQRLVAPIRRVFRL